MCIKVLRYLPVVILSCTLFSCGLRQSSSSAPHTESKTSAAGEVTLPVTVLVTNDAIEGPSSKASVYPKTVDLDWYDTTATRIAAYGAAHSLWLAPRGYTGSGNAGADGSISVILYPQGGSGENPPYVRYQAIPACVGCILSQAAIYFDNARADLLHTFDSTMLNMIRTPKGMVIQRISRTLTIYTYQKSNTQIRGVAYYSPMSDTSSGRFEQAEFALGADQKAMTDVLIRQYISLQGLK